MVGVSDIEAASAGAFRVSPPFVTVAARKRPRPGEARATKIYLDALLTGFFHDISLREIYLRYVANTGD
jgi:hypothetical protein